VAEPSEPSGFPHQLQVSILPEQRGGVWANFAKVTNSPYEFTLDFIRVDFGEQPPVGIVVSRVAVSPLFVTQLIDALQQNWDVYAKRALPEEVHGNDDHDSA
jgi:uncharacterized protein DUF3467